MFNFQKKCCNLFYNHNLFLYFSYALFFFKFQLTKDMTAKLADFDIARVKRQMHGPTTMTTKSIVKQPGSPFYQVLDGNSCIFG